MFWGFLSSAVLFPTDITPPLVSSLSRTLRLWICLSRTQLGSHLRKASLHNLYPQRVRGREPGSRQHWTVLQREEFGELKQSICPKDSNGSVALEKIISISLFEYPSRQIKHLPARKGQPVPLNPSSTSPRLHFLLASDSMASFVCYISSLLWCFEVHATWKQCVGGRGDFHEVPNNWVPSTQTTSRKKQQMTLYRGTVTPMMASVPCPWPRAAWAQAKQTISGEYQN